MAVRSMSTGAPAWRAGLRLQGTHRSARRSQPVLVPPVPASGMILPHVSAFWMNWVGEVL